MMGSASLYLSTKVARVLGAVPGRSLRSLPKPRGLESYRSLRNLRTPPIAAGMEDEAGRKPAPPALAAFAGVTRSRVSTSAGGGPGAGDWFELSPSSVLKLQKGDITKWFVDGSTDAIVNAANERMLGGGGVDGAIHRAAGPELREACSKVPEVRPGVRCPTGEARITPAFQLPVSHVIHTVGPIYDVDKQPDVSLGNAYRNSLRLAKENNIQYIAFPAISCGVYGYPYKEASRIAISKAKEFSDDFKEVCFVLFSDDLYRVWLESALELL
ncbi:macro domain-containing protein VPA0103-like [Phoenix dactylifera]|uniref:Macro domain-containing protein VPA0103-like n=1 Tax=Phoenix dactylifera TaxID=42345 RepID=A0A8B7CWZ5_PHODC|nr:macro domain-containing protein VPA0103-like [Phoenix dactylifera]